MFGKDEASIPPADAALYESATRAVKESLDSVFHTVEAPPCEYQTCIKGALFRAWARAAKYPAAECTRWLDVHGSPAGLSHEFDLDGIWPEAKPQLSVH